MGDNALKLEMAPYGEGMRYIQSSPQAPVITYAAKLNGLWLSIGAVAHLRKDLAITLDITAEEAECVRLERALRELAHEAEACYHIEENPPTWATRCMVSLQGERPGYDHSFGPTRLEALRAAVAHVRELRAEAERTKLPEPGEMALADVCAELRSFNYSEELHHRKQGPVAAWRCSFRPAIIQGDNETPLAFHRRALTEARKLDGAA